MASRRRRRTPRGSARLTSWTPSPTHSAPLIDLVTRAEAKALERLAVELRRDQISDALRSLDDIRAVLARWLDSRLVSQVVTAVGERARRAADAHWASEASRALGRRVGLDTRGSREVLQGWIAQNTARITTLRDETIRRVRDDLETAALSGTRPAELAAKWEREGLPTRNGRLRGRAQVIARDQLGTLASQIAQSQQRDLGLDEYMWDDRPDIEREQRLVHAGRRGARYRWDGPPPDGHPGEAILCECRAVAVVSLDQLAEVAGDPFHEGIPEMIEDPQRSLISLA